VVLLTTLLVAVPMAAAASLPSPTEPPAPGVPPAPGPGTTAVAPTTTSPTTASGTTTELKLGSAGDVVRDLQRALRRRGIKIHVDGTYGRQTRAAVRILQRRMHLTATGKANAAFLKRLGIRVRTVASSPVGLTAPSGGGRYLHAFPVNGDHTYSDDFGAPRATQSHQGNDIMAARGTPVVAVADGVIDRLTRVETGLGGIWIWLRDAEGNTFYYAHLDTIADGLTDGSTVAVGQQIGTVGNTGDARYGATHLHFEIHPGGAGATDPYTELLAVDPNPPTR
jgi:murein DD-endopeptidase MepM/ murein hydrolase activator NlpD